MSNVPAPDGGEILSAPGLLAAQLAPRQPILAPLLAQKSLMMLYGPRGLGKTFVALGLAWAAAAGGDFLKWRATRPHRVLYLDGEMAAYDMKERVAMMGPPPETLQFLLADLERDRLPDLGDGRGQRALFERCGIKPDLLVLDNLASLVGLKSDGLNRWSAMQRFLITLRRAGVAVLMVHHANKDGGQRGTSRHEDVLDVVLAIRRPVDYEPKHGARFELHFEKARGLFGEDADPLEARLSIDVNGRAQWDWRPLSLGESERAVALLRQGLNPLQVAREMKISKSKSYRLRQRAVEMGLVK
jgi:AAA domain-containing protein